MQLESTCVDCHEDFRCFLSAEPPPLSYMRNIPESLLQTCIKISNEAPKDLKSNLRRAWMKIDPASLQKCSPTQPFKACTFALCVYHSLILGRRRFGCHGWSTPYSFNTGDLEVCAKVLFAHIEGQKSVPWEEIRYIIGDIMYGGHITDFWDRRTNATYLADIFKKSLLKEGALLSNFNSPVAGKFDYAKYAEYIEKKLPPETPQLFGLNPNAEVCLPYFPRPLRSCMYACRISM